MKRLFLSLIALCWGSYIHCQDVPDTLRIMWYNVENLFDCRDDSLTDDQQFLPDGNMRWTYKRYQKKLVNISRVVAAVGNGHLPDLIGLCEIENERVLYDLTRRSLLKTAGYHFYVTQSLDERGIDVALLYRPERFTPINRKDIRIEPTDNPTRDILHLTGKVSGKDTLSLFLCHFPSRSAGRKETEPYRMQAARVLKQHTDSLQSTSPNASIIVMGDFNDHPTNRSLSQVLQSKPVTPGSTITPQNLYNLIYNKEKGSYFFQGNWEKLDQIIVSGSMLIPQSPLYTNESHTRIASFPFLLEYNERYGEYVPSRTLQGPLYKGGYSDHLPLVIDLIIKD